MLWISLAFSIAAIFTILVTRKRWKAPGSVLAMCLALLAVLCLTLPKYF